MAEIPKIALTGGPCAGKTTAVNYLKGVFGPTIIATPESATAILSSGYPLPGRDLKWTPEWQLSLQDAIYSLQHSVEQAASIAATQSNAVAVVTDRGKLDGAAYFENGVIDFEDRYNVSAQKIKDEYVAVIHMESLAVRSRHLYEAICNNNPTRFQSYENSLHLEAQVSLAWEGHTNRYIVNETSLDSRLIAVEGIIRTLLQNNINGDC